MTRDARCAGQVVIIVGVAIAALPRRHRMGTCQSKIHHGVIEGRRRPCDSGVALRAVGWEIGRDVIRVRRALKILQVTVNARRAGEVVDIVRVTVDALPWRDGMSAGQREPDGSMIEFRPHPAVDAVARLAGG